jgi:hypothetical protein
LVANRRDAGVPEILDERLARALAHPLRVQIMTVANYRAISPSEFARQHRADLSKVSYHFRELIKLECIELVDTRPSRGSTEHFYRGTRRALFGNTEWSDLPESIKGGVTGATLREFMTWASTAIEAGTFDRRDDRHLSWTALILDESGWHEMVEKLEATRVDILEFAEESAKRLAESGEPGVSATFALVGFESPEKSAK